MCGIFGYSFSEGTISHFQRGVLASLLARLNDTRGGHSWGVTGIQDKTPCVLRGLGDLAPNTADALEPYTTLFAHTRFATAGAKTVQNAHPFEIGDIIGAHNGVIYNHATLDRKYPSRRCDVDSMHLFEHLNAGLPFKDIDGYGSIEWVNKNDPGIINLSRMSGGSLCIFGIGSREDVRGIVWSSDDKHLKEALAAANLWNAFPYECKEGAVYQVINHKLYSSKLRCDLDDRVLSFTKMGRWSMYGDEHETAWERWQRRNPSGHVTTSGVISTKDGALVNEEEGDFELVEGGDRTGLNPDAPVTRIGKKLAKRLQRIKERHGEKVLTPSMLARLAEWEERRERRIRGYTDSAGGKTVEVEVKIGEEPKKEPTAKQLSLTARPKTM